MKGPRHSDPSAEAKRVLILGGGFGGIYAALRLEKLLARRAHLDVTIVTRENYFLFTPMLPEVAAGELELSTIINPLRLLSRVKSFVGMIEAIDLKARRVTVSHAFDGHTHKREPAMNYDVLYRSRCRSKDAALKTVPKRN